MNTEQFNISQQILELQRQQDALREQLRAETELSRMREIMNERNRIIKLANTLKMKLHDSAS